MDAAAEKDDWITAPAATATAEKDDWVTAPAAKQEAEQSAPPTVDDFGRPVDTAPINTDSGGSALGDIANATAEGAKEGFGTSPLGMSPKTDQALVKAGVFNAPDEYNPLKGINRAVIGGGAAVGDLALRAGGALVGAYQHGIAQAGESVGLPKLGRDLAALPEAFPTGDFHGGTAMPVAGIKASAMATEQRLASAKISAIGAATDIDGAIAAAGKAAEAPSSSAGAIDITGRQNSFFAERRTMEGPHDYMPNAVQLRAGEDIDRYRALGAAASSGIGPTQMQAIQWAEQNGRRDIIETIRDNAGTFGDSGAPYITMADEALARMGHSSQPTGGTATVAPVEAAASTAMTVVENPQVRLLRQTEGAILRRVAGDESKLTDAEGVRLSNIRAKMDEMQRPKEAPAQAGIDSTAAPEPVAGAPADPLAQTPTDPVAAPAAAENAAAPVSPSVGAAASRNGMDAHDTEAAVAGWRRLAPDEPRTVGQEIATDPRTGREYVKDSSGADIPGNAPSEPVPQSVGAAASRDMTHPSLIEMPPDEFAANRLQGETERLAAPPKINDPTLYIPDTKPTLAEVTGDPRTAMDQAYNAQQPEAMGEHSARANKNADAVADYYADTAKSAQELLRLERAKDARAAENINQIFGSPDDIRPPADATPVIDGIDKVLDHPRQQERGAVTSLLTNLRDRFFNNDGTMKTDPYSLYGIRDHIGDLLNGVGNTETSSAARVVQRELMQIREGVDDAIENAVPGFAKFRAQYAQDSGQISAMKMLQEARLSLLSGTAQHITPAKWFTFMRNVVEGRSDPFDPASHLSESQMDRLWNITDHLKRSTLIDAGKPRGSWTSMMQEWGGRFARIGAHGIAASTFPVVGNLGVEMGVSALRKRSVAREMNRLLNPDLGQQAP
jgi:hypothetical protein